MSPLFGHRDQPEASEPVADGSGALTDELDGLDALPLTQLASQVMSKGFGPGGPGADEDGTVTIGGMNVNAGPTIPQIAVELVPGIAARGVDDQVRQRLFRLVAEGLQALEHAGLIRVQMHTSMNSFDFALTRAGRAALERGEVESLLGSSEPS